MTDERLQQIRERVKVYCFVNSITPLGFSNEYVQDVSVVAVCGECRAVIASHISSNADWAHHDIMRPYHVEQCQQHAKEKHSADSVDMVWLDKPLAN